MPSELDSIQSSGTRAVKGNADPKFKAIFLKLHERFKSPRSSFGASIYARLEPSEASVVKYVDEPEREMVKVVFEGEVTEDMCNGGGNMHGGCSAFLVDMCTSHPLILMKLMKGAKPVSGVSQSINTNYHAPLPLGVRIKVVCTTIAVGSRILSARCEIWDATNHRLAVTGVHIKMEASPAPSKL